MHTLYIVLFYNHSLHIHSLCYIRGRLCDYGTHAQCHVFNSTPNTLHSIYRTIYKINQKHCNCQTTVKQMQTKCTANQSSAAFYNSPCGGRGYVAMAVVSVPSSLAVVWGCFCIQLLATDSNSLHNVKRAIMYDSVSLSHMHRGTEQQTYAIHSPL